MAGIAGSCPLVSVIVPAHNHQRYVARCLDSVLEDTYPNKELVIIDDGSTDKTDERIKDWTKRHNAAISVSYGSRDNLGISRTLNELVARCKGTYVVPLASDDCLLPDGIARRVSYLEQHTEKLAVFGDCVVIDERDQVVHDSGIFGLYSARPGRYQSDEGLRDEIIARWAVPGPVLMVNKRIYDEIGLYDSNLHIEDWDFYLRMVSKNLLGYTNWKVGAYRLHDCSNIRQVSQVSRKLFLYQELFKTAVKHFATFQGRGRRLLIRKILFLSCLLLRNWLRRSK